MDKLILKKETTISEKGKKPIFINADLHKQLTKLKDETGIPMTKIINSFIHYGIENVIIKEEDKD